MAFKKFACIVFAAALVTACSTKPDESGSIATDGDLTTSQRAPISGLDEYNTAADTSGPAGGTQQDLVLNVGDRVFFGYDQHDLSAEARGQLEQQAAWMGQNPSVVVTIEGHADERGTREYNLALGERRAQAARNYLIALGVDGSRVDTISFGKERPAVVGANPSSWAQNRRAVMVVR